MDSPVNTREQVSRLILCLLSVKVARKFNNTWIATFGVLLVNYLGTAKLFNRITGLLLPHYDQTFIDKYASLLLRLKPVKKELVKPINEHVAETRENTKKLWKKFGPLVTKIPDIGYSEDKLMELIDFLGNTVDNGIIGEDISGSIYPLAFRREKKHQRTSQSNSETNHSYESLLLSLESLFSHALSRSYLWNSLHESEFGIGYWLNYQVVRMVADLYIKTNGNNARENVMGLITSGGTDSLMNMVRLYKEWGKVNRNLDFGEGILVTCQNVHAAVDKGCMACGIRLVKVPWTTDGSISIPHFKEAVENAGNNLVGCVVSTPSFTLGSVDNVKEAAAITKAAGVGLHIDSCLGGFVINFLEESYDPYFLDIPGVTSISCDTHKNGWAPKGSSVLLTMPVPTVLQGEINLFYYSSFAIPGWDGGVYGSPGNPGSQHCSHVLQAYLSMLRIGKEGYRDMAKKINQAVNGIYDIIKHDHRIQVLGEQTKNKKGVNVIAFKINPALNWGVGASYALAYHMSKHNVVVSAVSQDRVHYAVTGRSALDSGFIERFEKAFTKGIKETEEAAQQVIAGKASFGGDAGLYGTLDAAMSPTSENTKSTGEMIGNKILGKRAVNDLVRAHFWALQDPFSNEKV